MGYARRRRAGLWTALAAAATLAAPLASANPLVSALPQTIVVTAERRAQPRDAVAASISQFALEEIAQTAPIHPAQLLNQAPGVGIHRNSGQEHLTAIRSPVLTAGAGAGSFLYLEDGVPLRAAGFANVNGLFEAQFEMAGGVEIFRGPGSIVYGSNAVHGLINVISPTPSEAPSARFNLRIKDSAKHHDRNGSFHGVTSDICQRDY